MTIYNIDISNIFKIAKHGIIEAELLLGFGINAANNNLIKSHTVPDTNISMLAETEDQEELSKRKIIFKNSIIDCAYKLLLDRFSQFTEELFFAALVFSSEKQPIPVPEFEKIKKRFKKNSRDISVVLKSLESDFSITSNHTDLLVALYNARTTVTHYQGIVPPKFSPLKISFLKLQAYVKFENGEEIPLGTKPIEAQNAGYVIFKVEKKLMEFKKGDKLTLEPQDIKEISLFIDICLNHLGETTMKMLKKWKAIP